MSLLPPRKPGEGKKLGRPKGTGNYKKEHCRRVIEIGREGKTCNYFCTETSISRETFHRWTEEYKEFKDAVTLAKTFMLSFYEEQMRQYLTGELVMDRTQVNALMFVLRTQGKDDWSEPATAKQNINIENKIHSMPKEKLDSQLEQLLERHNLSDRKK